MHNLFIYLCMHVCEFRYGSICVHPFTHWIVYIYLCMFVCMHSVYICMYVSIHNSMSVCERCM